MSRIFGTGIQDSARKPEDAFVQGKRALTFK
jgi:hypothetical protein